jgi:uncharacterized protein (UPF0276 family)
MWRCGEGSGGGTRKRSGGTRSCGDGGFLRSRRGSPGDGGDGDVHADRRPHGGPGRAGRSRPRRRQAGRAESGGQEGRSPEGVRRGGELRRRHLRRGQQKENLVTGEGGREVRGVGLGLRWEFLEELVARSGEGCLPLDFLEISPENYLRRGGRYPQALAWLAARYPVVTHGLTLSLGGPDPLDEAYLDTLKGLLRTLGTPWHSDHLCIGAIDGRAVHDLLPVSHKVSSVARIADRIRAAEDRLGLPLAIENISYYWHPGRAEMGEAEFLARVCDAADCGLVLDVNNAYVNAVNFGFDAEAWMATAPLERVVQIHVAGHEWFLADERGLGETCPPESPGALIVDTHGAETPDPVLSLLERVLARTGPVPVLLERDHNVPSLDVLMAETRRIRAICERATRGDPPREDRQIQG